MIVDEIPSHDNDNDVITTMYSSVRALSIALAPDSSHVMLRAQISETFLMLQDRQLLY